MEDIIGVVTSIARDEYNNKEFLRVTIGGREEPLKVKQGRDGALKAKWDLIKEGVAIKFIMSEYTNPQGAKFPFVSDIETVESALPPPVKPTLTPEMEAELPHPAPAPQEIGMWLKEAGELIRMPQEEALKLVKPDLLKAIRTAYFAKMFSVLDIRVEK